MLADGPAGRAAHHRGDDAEPGVIVDASDNLGVRSVSQPDTVNDVQLPQLHRTIPLPACVVLPPPAPGSRLHQAVPHQHPVDRAHRRNRTGATGAAQLELDPALTPPRMRPPQLADRGLDLRAGLRRMRVRPMRTISETVQTLFAIPADPSVHRLPRHPEPLGHLGDRHPGLNFQHSAIPLLRHSQLHQHSAECHASSEATM
jgi:hypothetical protein